MAEPIAERGPEFVQSMARGRAQEESAAEPRAAATRCRPILPRDARPGVMPGPPLVTARTGWQAGVMPVTARVEHVGSLLRPPYLHRARTRPRRGRRSPRPRSRRLEDRAVREVVALQEEIGLPVVNDGELRRESFQAELTAACDGFAGVGLDAWLWGDWHSAEAGDASAPRPAGAGGGRAAAQAAEPRGRGVHLRARLHRPIGQGDAAEPDAVRQPLVAGTVGRRLPGPGRLHGRRGRAAA